MRFFIAKTTVASQVQSDIFTDSPLSSVSPIQFTPLGPSTLDFGPPKHDGKISKFLFS